MSEPITTEEIQALRALCEERSDVLKRWETSTELWTVGDRTFMGAYERRAGDMMPRLLDEIEHERQTVDTLRDNIYVMTVESLDDKDEIQRLKELARELAVFIRYAAYENRGGRLGAETLLNRPDVAALMEESDA